MAIQDVGSSILSTGNNLYAYKLGDIYVLEEVGREETGVIRPEVCAPLVKLWTQCYLRWQTPGVIQGGGNPSAYIHQCALVEAILDLQHKLESLEQNTDSMNRQRPSSKLIFSLAVETPTTPCELLNSTGVSSSFPFSTGTSSNEQNVVFTPISAYLENSAIEYDYSNSED